MFQRFTEASRRSLFFARYAATEARSSVMQLEHLLEGVLEAAPASVSDADSAVALIRERLSTATNDAPAERPTLHEIIFSVALKRALQGAAKAADQLGHTQIRPEHLLIALLEETDSAAAQALRFANVDRPSLEARAKRRLEHATTATRPARPDEASAPEPPARPVFAILHDVMIAASPAQVFAAVSTAEGLDQWWTLKSEGAADIGSEFALHFGAGADWRAIVMSADAPSVFELEMTTATEDWQATRITFELEPRAGKTLLRFSHAGWSAMDDHFRQTSYCWAMYLRILRRHLEHGESVAYAERLRA